MVLQYISKYVSKAKPSLIIFTDIFNQFLNNSKSDDPSLTSIQKFLLNSIVNRDISTQETYHLLFGISLYYSSHLFVTLNLSEQALRWICRIGSSDNSENLIRSIIQNK